MNRRPDVAGSRQGAASALETSALAVFVSWNRTMITCVERAMVLPGAGAVNLPRPYRTVCVARIGVCCRFPAASTASAQMAVKRPTPCEPAVVTARTAGFATGMLSVVRESGVGDLAEDVGMPVADAGHGDHGPSADDRAEAAAHMPVGVGPVWADCVAPLCSDVCGLLPVALSRSARVRVE